MFRDSSFSDRELTTREEIQRLLRLAQRDLAQARVPGLYPDGQFVFAYNAALQLATVYLRLHDIRIRAAHYHLRTSQKLESILSPEQRQFALEFEHARRKRHSLMYDQAGVISEAEAKALIEMVQEFRIWLGKELVERFAGFPDDKLMER